MVPRKNARTRENVGTSVVVEMKQSSPSRRQRKRDPSAGAAPGSSCAQGPPTSQTLIRDDLDRLRNSDEYKQAFYAKEAPAEQKEQAPAEQAPEARAPVEPRISQESPTPES